MRQVLRAFALFTLLSTSALADRGTYSQMGSCENGNPRTFEIVNAPDADTCTAGGGAFEVHCCCLDGSWDKCETGTGGPGGSDSFATIDLPAGTDPVADSATDTLTVTCPVPMVCTGTSTPDAWAITWSGSFADAQVDGSLESDEVVPASRTLDAKTTATTINNTAAETTIYTYTIPANTVDANSSLVLTILGDFINNSGANRNYTIKVKLGGSTVLDWNTGNLATSATRRIIPITIQLAALGATNSQIVSMFGSIDAQSGLTGTLTTGVGFGTTALIDYAFHSGALSQDMTTSKVLEVTVQLSTNLTTLEFKAWSAALDLKNP